MNPEERRLRRRAIERRYYAKRRAAGWRQQPTPVNLEAVMSHVVKTEDHWHWTGGTQANGYGHTKWGVAHRVIYEALVGPVPDGLELDHLCRNRACVRPDHLEPVTHATNLRRGAGVGPQPERRKTHCLRGHDLALAYVTKEGWRHCRACRVVAA